MKNLKCRIFVQGQNLQKWLAKVGRFSVADAVYVTLACARGLGYAHKQGMVHRDIKPENILLTKAGAVKIADLGMVKTFEDDMSLTQTGHAVGTPWARRETALGCPRASICNWNLFVRRHS